MNKHAFISHPWISLAVFMGVFFLLSVFMVLIDVYPEPKLAITDTDTVEQKVVTVAALDQAVRTPQASARTTNAYEPTRLVIPAIGVDTQVVNPVAKDIASLDAALLTGAARYPGTARINEEGTILIFGHQSYLPVVRNPAFKALNDVQKLSVGDTITVFAGDVAAEYRVRSVELTTTDTGSIPLETQGQTLMLVTCNSLGAKEERYIVKADRILITQTTN